MLRVLAALALSAAIALPSRLAVAQETEREALEEARAALRAGDPELAIDILDEAREGSDAPVLRYELYVAHEQAGQRAEAAAHLEAYLASDDPSLDPEQRAALAGHLADLRASLSPTPSGDPWADPAVPVLGWTLLAGGIVGVIGFPVGAAIAFTLEAQLDPGCRADESLCAPGARDDIETAWIAGSISLASGLVLGAIGAVLLFLSGESQRGGSRSLPPDLDPSMQRGFSLAPWVDPARGEGGGTMTLSF